MNRVSVREGKLCIVRATEITTVKEGLEELKKTLIDAADQPENRLDSYIFIDFSAFNVINSSMIGVIGSIALMEHVRHLGLCGLRPSVKDILCRFGVIPRTENCKPLEASSDSQLKKDLQKVRAYPTVEDGLMTLA